MRPHPSGRPVRKELRPKRAEGIWRCPLIEPLVPRLRKDFSRFAPEPVADAIGFIPVPEHDPETWTWAKRK
jgi:hypothetical protein